MASHPGALARGVEQGGQPPRLFYFAAPISLRCWFCDAYIVHVFHEDLDCARLFEEDLGYSVAIL